MLFNLMEIADKKSIPMELQPLLFTEIVDCGIDVSSFLYPKTINEIYRHKQLPS